MFQHCKHSSVSSPGAQVMGTIELADLRSGLRRIEFWALCPACAQRFAAMLDELRGQEPPAAGTH